MKVFLNSVEICVGSRGTLKDLMLSQSIQPEGIAVAINNRVIPKEEWGITDLRNGDKIIVIKATCGG